MVQPAARLRAAFGWPLAQTPRHAAWTAQAAQNSAVVLRATPFPAKADGASALPQGFHLARTLPTLPPEGGRRRVVRGQTRGETCRWPSTNFRVVSCSRAASWVHRAW